MHHCKPTTFSTVNPSGQFLHLDKRILSCREIRCILDAPVDSLDDGTYGFVGRRGIVIQNQAVSFDNRPPLLNHCSCRTNSLEFRSKLGCIIYNVNTESISYAKLIPDSRAPQTGRQQLETYWWPWPCTIIADPHLVQPRIR